MDTGEVAYYYPQPFWDMRESDSLKSLLLFFDRIAILLPRYMHGREILADPVFAGPLERQGLLEVLEPETFVDKEVAEALRESVLGLIEAGAFDGLDKKVYYQELSYSRMGWSADVDLGKSLVKVLAKRGLAKKSEDGVSVPLHPKVRTTILVLISQLARGRGRRLGLDLHPVTSDRSAASGMVETLGLPTAPSAGHVVTLDLEAVGVDLSTVPLDEVIGFRDQHAAEFRAYARKLRELVAALSPLDQADRDRLLADRREEMADEAHSLRKTAMRAWQTAQPVASVGLGVVGATWAVQEGNLGWAALNLALGIVGAALPQSEVGAYSYLYSVRDAFGSGRIGWE
ncbi:MAG TPA: hypothetical protein VNL94_06720 [Candidatus Binatia bacterium]|nr:hypothetical protein [Candidatus Binatia bacterium]